MNGRKRNSNNQQPLLPDTRLTGWNKIYNILVSPHSTFTMPKAELLGS